jgi:hypothetical protein
MQTLRNFTRFSHGGTKQAVGRSAADGMNGLILAGCTGWENDPTWKQVRTHNFSLRGGGGADPEAIYNLFDFKNYVIKIMS